MLVKLSVSLLIIESWRVLCDISLLLSSCRLSLVVPLLVAGIVISVVLCLLELSDLSPDLSLTAFVRKISIFFMLPKVVVKFRPNRKIWSPNFLVERLACPDFDFPLFKNHCIISAMACLCPWL